MSLIDDHRCEILAAAKAHLDYLPRRLPKADLLRGLSAALADLAPTACGLLNS